MKTESFSLELSLPGTRKCRMTLIVDIYVTRGGSRDAFDYRKVSERAWVREVQSSFALFAFDALTANRPTTREC